MTPLYLPIAHADLSRRIAAHWSGERGVARCAGVDPNKIRIEVMPDLSLILLGPPEPPADRRSAPLALRFLLDALEDEGLAVDREIGRVLGWAAVEDLCSVPCPWTEEHQDACRMCSGELCSLCGAGCWNNDPDRNCQHDVTQRHRELAKVSVVSLDITDPRRSTHFDAVLADRLARRTPVGVDAKREGAMRRGAAAYRGGGR